MAKIRLQAELEKTSGLSSSIADAVRKGVEQGFNSASLKFDGFQKMMDSFTKQMGNAVAKLNAQLARFGTSSTGGGGKNTFVYGAKQQLAEVEKMMTRLKTQIGQISNGKFNASGVQQAVEQYRKLEAQIHSIKNGEKSMTEAQYQNILKTRNGIESLIGRIKQQAEATKQAAAAQKQAAADAVKAANMQKKQAAAAQKQAAADAVKAANMQKKQADLAISIQSYLGNNSKVAAAYSGQFADMLGKLQGQTPLTAQELAKISEEFNRIKASASAAGLAGQTFYQQLRGVFSRFTGWGLMTTAIMTVTRKLKEMVANVREIDAAMTDLNIIVGLTASSYERVFRSASKMAGEVGASVVDTIKATTD